MSVFRPKMPRLTELLTTDEIEQSEYVDCVAFIKGLQKGIFQTTMKRDRFSTSMRKRGRFLMVLDYTNPWVRLPDSFLVEMISNILLPMMDDYQTSQEHHLLLASVMSNYDFCIKAQGDLLWEFTRRVHMMLEEGKEEAWFYLDAVCDYWLLMFYVVGKRTHKIVNILQHLGTPLLILDKLERNDPIENPLSRRRCGGDVEFTNPKVLISLQLMRAFAQCGSLSNWVESDLDRLLDIIGPVWMLNCDFVIRVIAEIFAALDSRELNKLDLPMLLSKIQNSDDVKTCISFLIRLTSSLQFRDFVTTPRLMNLMLSTWKNHDTFNFWNLLDDDNLLEVWANLADVALSSALQSEFVLVAKEKLKELDLYKGSSIDVKSLQSYEILRLKTSRIMIDPTNIRYIQNNIGSRFGSRFDDGKRVDDTKRALQSNILSPHRIPPINVFPW
eukprot:CAMPEP_0194397700 /NCGR_PEP_ID=MMETSP0174-20130528/125689_1 /TAXON_ID=216777 /ORGANISM="Proboscia alata, Strain PI-D3" /LENGTH=442 /DNA_ID=CAMNT_0039193905 /DNA_START=13 /DNA_END=1338 /DNA_ORIENTATION=-